MSMDSRPDDFDIPAEVFDQIAAEEAAARGTSGTSSEAAPTEGGSRVKICQYCTFQNTHSGTDCEVCGLPF
jgi:nuclear protein localization family protein 4